MTQFNSDTVESEQQPGKHEEWQVQGKELVATVEKLFHEGNVRRIIIKHEEHTVLEIPLTIGIVSTLLAPWLAAIGAVGALLTHCTVEVVRADNAGETPVI